MRETNGKELDTMEELVKKHIEDCVDVKRQLARTNSKIIARIAEEMIRAYQRGNKLVWFGNGGSAADAQHLSCELTSKFYLKRKALESLALTTNTSVLTAIANDYDFDEIFSRQVEAVVKPGDIVIGISTSGNSQNVIRGIEEAKRQGATTVAFTGASGGKIKESVDFLVAVPSVETARIQESHIMIGHILCYLVEKGLFGEHNG
jgi:D-sedoheptulose 7-phosphate isomerase